MDAASHAHHHESEFQVALSATLHCLTGCAIGEVAGFAIGTALGFSDLGTIAPASDTLSIALMEIVDNAIVLIIPGAMDAGLGDLLFWGSLSVALVVAGAFALPLNRWLIARG